VFRGFSRGVARRFGKMNEYYFFRDTLMRLPASEQMECKELVA